MLHKWKVEHRDGNHRLFGKLELLNKMATFHNFCSQSYGRPMKSGGEEGRKGFESSVAPPSYAVLNDEVESRDDDDADFLQRERGARASSTFAVNNSLQPDTAPAPRKQRLFPPSQEV